MNKFKILIFCVISELLVITFISVANMFDGVLFGIFYNVLYGLVISTILPLFFLFTKKENFSSVGIRKMGTRQVIVLFAFVVFSIGGQLIPKVIEGEYIAWTVLPLAIAPLVMTTFFEEFLFRGFVQTRVEKNFGYIVAILVSAVMFSVYHLGYPGFRTVGDILLLFAVGLGFAIAYKLSDNNLIVSYFVNLPNAFVTYVFKSEQFPKFTVESSIYAVITIVAVFIILIVSKTKIKRLTYK